MKHPDVRSPGFSAPAMRSVTIGLILGLVATLVVVAGGASAQGNQSMRGVIWFDTNSDGIRQADEPRAQGVSYQLVEFDSGVVERVVIESVSGLEGEYGTDGLTPGVYGLTIMFPDGYLPGPLGEGDDVTLNNDFPRITGQSTEIQLTVDLRGGSTFPSQDLGLVQSGEPDISGLVWFDENRNGLQEPGEIGAAGVGYDLVQFDPGRPPIITFSGVTDLDGSYEITPVTPGEYLVSVRLPDGYLVGPLDVGGDDSIDNDYVGNTVRAGANAAISEGQTLANVDAGLIRDVRGDANCDGVLNILDAFATAQYVVDLRDGVAVCPLVSSTSQVSLWAVSAMPGEPVNIQNAFQVSQCVVGLSNALCPAEAGL